MSNNEPAISFDQIWMMLDSPNAEDRKDGLLKMCELIRHDKLPITDEFIDAVFARPLRHLVDPELLLWREAARSICHAMLKATKAMKKEYEAIQKELERAVQAKYDEVPRMATLLLPGSLGQWMFEEFHKPSWLAYLADTRPRDEKAVMLLINLLAKAEFPLLTRKDFLCGSFTFTLPKTADIKALLQVGRPMLYFASPNDAADWDMKHARYRFPFCNGRQYNLDKDKWPDPEYHCILERVAAEVEPVRYQADLTDGVLTDYAIIQKYEVVMNGHTVVVLRIAGCTFLGTFAGVHWATCEVLDEYEPGRPVPAAPQPENRRGRNHGRLEALIKVTAQLDPHKVKLPSMKIEVLDLRVGGWAWYQDDFDWKTPTPRHIVLYHPKNQRPTNTNVTAVWLDGDPTHAQAGTETLRLLVALCRLTQQHGAAAIPIRELADDETIWSDDEREHSSRLVKQVAPRLRQLNDRHLGRAVKIDLDKGLCYLDAEVLFVEEES